MTIYVDHAQVPFRGMLMCHLFAEMAEVPDLSEYADDLRGADREWFKADA